MRKISIIIASLSLLLAFAQCTKDKEKEHNIELANEALLSIEDNFQMKLDLLSEVNDSVLLESLAVWVNGFEGVESAATVGNHVLIYFIDGTEARIEIFDRTVVGSTDSIEPIRPIMHKSDNGVRKDIVIEGRRAFIWDAFSDYFSFEYDGEIYNDAQFVQSELDGVLEIDYLAESECTVDALRNLTSYSFVYLSTHGDVDAFATGERVTDGNREKYRAEMDAGQVGRSFMAYKVEGKRTFYGQFFYVTNQFINALNGRFGHSMVIVSACHSLVESQPILCHSFMNKGVSSYFGYDNDVASEYTYNTNANLVRQLVLGRNTGYAFDRVIRKYPYQDYNDEDGNYLYTTVYRMDGARDLSLFDNPPVPTDGLVAYYPFNGNANDESGNGNDGILSGDNVPVITTDRNNLPNSAYEFGGYYNYNWIRVPNSESLMFDKEMTISFWIQQSEFAGMNGWMNYSTTDPGFAAICKAGDGNATYPGLYIMTGIGENGEGIHVSTNNSNGNAHYQSNHNHNINCDKKDYLLGDWLNVILVVDNTDKMLYLDGVKMASDELNVEANFTSMNGQDLYIGIMAGGNMTYSMSFGAWYPFYGKIDDIRIYNRALPYREVYALYKE